MFKIIVGLLYVGFNCPILIDADAMLTFVKLCYKGSRALRQAIMRSSLDGIQNSSPIFPFSVQSS